MKKFGNKTYLTYFREETECVIFSSLQYTLVRLSDPDLQQLTTISGIVILGGRRRFPAEFDQIHSWEPG